MMEVRFVVGGALLAGSLACSASTTSNGDFGTGESTATDETGTTSPTTASGTSTTDSSSGEETGPIFDVGMPNPERCEVGEDLDGIGPCEVQAPPDSFDPEVKWSFMPDDAPQSVTIPLVANLTDDNGDGEVNLCDDPDIVVSAHGGGPGRMFILDGKTGNLNEFFALDVQWTVSPAIGDVDGDGEPEIVAAAGGGIVAFNGDGSLAWSSEDGWSAGSTHSLALADLDNDGHAEVIMGKLVGDDTGAVLWTADVQEAWAPTAADLDGDGDLEVIYGFTAYHHDGSVYYQTCCEQFIDFPQVADLDADGLPEVLISNAGGLTVLEHDGSIKVSSVNPNGLGGWIRPAAIHDLDGDGAPEIAIGTSNQYAALEADLSVKWLAAVDESSGFASGTAFDFLGDAEAEAIYGDEQTLFVFNGMGQSVLSVPRSSWTQLEYPVVADVDNDGSAEIVVTSAVIDGMQSSPTIQVIGDKEDRWIPGRRIWNQHTYHVTNVLEDGTIPQFEQPHWQSLNTFRTQAQSEGGTVCEPEG